jgi:hypothetical protein
MSADPHPAVKRALEPLANRCKRLEALDRFHEATRMLEGCRLGLTTFAELRVSAIRELAHGMNNAQLAELTGLSRARIKQIRDNE